MSTRPERGNREKRIVESLTLSTFISEEVDFIKMDIEGAELEVIEELRDKNKLRYVRQMAIEYHHHLDKGKDNFSELLNILETSGFGYQISASQKKPLCGKTFQDILVLAYRK